jgi:hypothetical protein
MSSRSDEFVVEGQMGQDLARRPGDHVANVVVAVLLIVVYTLLAVGPQREPSGGITDPLASQVAIWLVPILTLFSAAWVARKVRPETASLHGLLMGFLVAIIFAVLYFGPFDPPGFCCSRLRSRLASREV